MGTHGKHEAGKWITQNQSWGDNIKRGRMLALMVTMMCTSSTIKTVRRSNENERNNGHAYAQDRERETKPKTKTQAMAQALFNQH